MSLWGLFIIVGSIGVILSLGAAIVRPRDRSEPPGEIHGGGSANPRARHEDSLTGLQSRVDALEIEVDDLHRAIAALREENEYLQQRIDGDVPGSRTGEYS